MPKKSRTIVVPPTNNEFMRRYFVLFQAYTKMYTAFFSNIVMVKIKLLKCL